MNLSKLTTKRLIANAKALVKQESCVLVQILHYIAEMDRRRLCAEFRVPGLLELVMTELGYPRDQALRRIQAMRMMRDNPVVEQKLEIGELNLTSVGIVQTLFSNEKREGKPLTAKEKLEVIEQVSGKSTREAQKIVLARSSTPPKLNEKIKMIAPELYELTAVIDEETLATIEKLKGLLAHSHPNISNGKLIKVLAQIGVKELQRVKPVKGDRSARGRSAAPRPDSKAETQRQIWARDEHKCSNCGSMYAVQEDHRIAKAKGGRYTLSNMRLLCRSCNQHAAIYDFGVQHMEKFLVPEKGMAPDMPPPRT